MEERRSIDVVGVPVSAFSIEDATSTIEAWIAARARGYVCATSAHGVVECLSDPDLRAIHREAGMIVPDGMPLVWMCRLLGEPNATRVYGPDLMRTMTAISAERGYRHFYYGGGPGVAEALRETLTERHPGLIVSGVYTPPFRPLTELESQAIIDEINAAKPDIVWVGLSTPKQERWMARHFGKIDAPVMIGVGAAFDFLSDRKTEAPEWLRGSGFEWLYRLVTEPRRLWRRYVVVVPVFLTCAIGQLLRERVFGRPPARRRAAPARPAPSDPSREPAQ
jgi:N-acetylglucosaminyldiphosphoundecaprenol N-acetyl-beta-D-mannosaminyltransferase